MLHIYIYFKSGETFLLSSDGRLYKNDFTFTQYEDYEDAHNVEMLFREENSKLMKEIERIDII